MDDDEEVTYTFCPRCFLTPMNRWSSGVWREEGLICSWCIRKERKAKRRAKGKFPCPSKPLNVRGRGYSFYPDSMMCVANFKDHNHADRQNTKQRNVRQRRVNEFIIQEQLEAMEELEG